jgi:hypothetical protein
VLASAAAVADFWRRLAAEPRLAPLLQRTALLEQPIARQAALRERIDGGKVWGRQAKAARFGVCCSSARANGGRGWVRSSDLTP